MVLNHARNLDTDKISIADIVAGTGNLSILLAAFKNTNIIAIEPNQNMMDIGLERTKLIPSIKWVQSIGTQTGLPDSCVDLVTFGSSFNVMDRPTALEETARILRPHGYFCCMWNHRDLNDKIQMQAEKIITSIVPEYTRGVRREDQRPIIEQSGLFTDIVYIEMDFNFEQTLDTYINAWKSVKNKYWENDSDIFRRICDKFKLELPNSFSVKYTSRCWIAKRK
jgi:SAM-dependent methyltransferase